MDYLLLENGLNFPCQAWVCGDGEQTSWQGGEKGGCTCCHPSSGDCQPGRRQRHFATLLYYLSVEFLSTQVFYGVKINILM